MSKFVTPVGTLDTSKIEVHKDQTMRKYDIWREGYLVQGMEGVPEKAAYVGSEYGVDFVDACRRYYMKNRSPEEFKRYWYVADDGTPCFWCSLYDNEADARKSFG